MMATDVNIAQIRVTLLIKQVDINENGYMNEIPSTIMDISIH